jgi:hypothetical protein
MPRSAAALGLSISLHILAALLVAGPPVPLLKATPRIKPRKAMTVFFVAPTEDATFAGLKPVDRTRDEWTRPRGQEPSALRIGDVKIDLDKFRQRAHVLFPFLTPGLSLDSFVPAPQTQLRAHLENPYASARRRREASKVHQPLTMREAALQSLVDKSWSRRDRWAAFEPIGRLAQAHDPDAGQVPRLLQQYRDQNSLQPYADTVIRDPRLWAQLGIAADHVTFIAFIRRFASEHPSTRATTELLFLLDRLAEANADALDLLRDTDPAERLDWTRQRNADAYQLIAGIRRYYQGEADRLGLKTDEAVNRHYDKARLAILDAIVRTTPGGYRASDARYLIGAIHWRQRNLEEALRWWRELTLDAGDSYVIASSQIVETLRGRNAPQRGAGNIDPALRREIDQILKNERGRWVMFSFDRLRRFGYHFDSF